MAETQSAPASTSLELSAERAPSLLMCTCQSAAQRNLDICQPQTGEVAIGIQGVGDGAVGDGRQRVALGVGAPGGDGLAQAQQFVAAGLQAHGLAVCLVEVHEVKVSVLIRVAGGLLDGQKAVGVGIVAVAGAAAGVVAVEAGEAVAVVVACVPAQCGGEGAGAGEAGGRIQGVQGRPQVLGDAGDAAGGIKAVLGEFVAGHAAIGVEMAAGGAGCEAVVPGPGGWLVQGRVGQAGHKGGDGFVQTRQIGRAHV